MKKLMGISVIAALAVLPMAANAARSNTVAVANYTAPTAQEAATSGIATTSYVKGAYKEASDRIDALVTDTAVAAKANNGTYAAIVAGNSVSENLVALDDKVATLESATDTTTGVLTDLTTQAKNNLVAAINEVDSHADANAAAIEILNGNNTTNGSVAKSIKDTVETLDASESQTAGADGLALSITEVDGKITAISGSIAANTYDAYGSAAAEETRATAVEGDLDDLETEVKTNLVGAINEVNTAVSTLTQSASNTYQTLSDSEVTAAAAGTYTAINAGNAVGDNLEALDSHVKTNEGAISTINNKSINVNTTWGNDTVVAQKKISELPAYVPQI